MTKVKIEVLDAIVDGKKRGEHLEVEQASADQLVRIGYAKIVKEVEQPKDETAPKKAPARKPTAKK